ncbi:oligopeptide ABC transporter, periplasmic oligopeptide-binding protein OppA [Agrilactobacillus composti DSM 18527 = JCM 14202]|nr:ABC transporter substrate-binding protein [Agrilactobacillus composti]GAF39764.1 oligopeptide ABC transporter, periplasmic oligopeptide-binding protein OppA [Agrilactobacillus composti DSM 18527 = JCM 14202]
MKLTRLVLAGAVLMTVGILTKGSPNVAQAASSKQILNWTESIELATADASKATDTLSFNVLLNTQEGLYRLDKNGTPKLALAKSANVSKDGLTYTFELRHGAKWSNGDPVVAKDFVYAWQRTLDPKTTSQDAFYLYQSKMPKPSIKVKPKRIL